MKIRKTPAPWIHKTSLDLIINKTKKLLKKILSDQIFQKLKLKFFLLYKTENIMLIYWIKHPSDTCRQLSFRTSSLYTKITGLSYTKKAAEGCWISDKNCKKKVVLNQDSNQGPSREAKMNEIQTKALPLSHRGWYKITTVIISQIIMYLNLA